MSLDNNPFINKPEIKHGAIPFDDIKQEHFIPALDYAILDANGKLEEVKKNPEPPTFENTVLPMETCDELMGTVSHTYFNLMSAESNNKFKVYGSTKNNDYVQIMHIDIDDSDKLSTKLTPFEISSLITSIHAKLAEKFMEKKSLTFFLGGDNFMVVANGVKNAEVVVISPFEYTSFIFVGVMGYFFYNEIPNTSIVIGGLLIILGGVYIAYRENKFDENKIKIR